MIKNQYQKAINMMRAGIELYSDVANYWDTLACLLYESTNKEEAIKAIYQAIEINPDEKYYKKTLKKFK